MYVESWLALEELHAEGLARSVGISNFLPHHYADLKAASSLVPAINQVELHPTFQQRDVTAAMVSDGVVIEAYSPLGQGADLTTDAVAPGRRGGRRHTRSGRPGMAPWLAAAW